jgi:hypothetical protein
MLEFYVEVDPELQTLEKELLAVEELQGFKAVLEQAFSAFRRGDYAITIPALTPVLEQSVRCFGEERMPSTDVEKLLRKRYARAKEAKARFLFAIASLNEFIGEYYKNYRPTVDPGERVRRHGISHGTQTPPNSKVEAIRLFHVISTVTELYEYVITPPVSARTA